MRGAVDRAAAGAVGAAVALSLLGLVRHMAEVERNWFRRVLAGEDAGYLYCSDDDEDGDFNQVDTADPDEDFATWRAECAHARDNAAAVDSLDAVGTRKRHDQDVSCAGSTCT